MLPHVREDSCIAASTIGSRVLQRLGVAATVEPVTALVFNQQALRVRERYGEAALAQSVRRFAPEDRYGPWTLGVGIPGQPPLHAGAWPGHLVLGIHEHATLIDLSADQFSRPHKRIEVSPLVVNHVPTEWWEAGDGSGWVTVDTTGGVRVFYSHVPANVGYRDSPDFAWPPPRRALYESLVEQITDRIVAELGRRAPGLPA